MLFKKCLLLLAALSTVTAFAPSHVSQQRLPTTRLYESIVEAEDRYLAQAVDANSVMEKPEVAYTIVYNPGTPEEGIHTMKYPRGTDQDVMLIFEGAADCIVFARTITEDPSMDQSPNVTPTNLNDIEQALANMGIQSAFVPMEQKTEW